MDFSSIRAILGEPNPLSAKKIYTYLNDRMLEFIESTSLVMISSVDEEGFPTISPKGDAAGFIGIKDNKTLQIPERKGNKLAFTFRNVVESNKVGLLFMVPGTPVTLRATGTVRLIHDKALNKKLASRTQEALLVSEISIEKAYFHCAKPLLRSDLWSPSKWRQEIKVSFGTEIAENVGESEDFIEEFDAAVDSRYKTDL